MEEKHKDYYEGILQLRNINNEMLDSILNESKNNKNFFISQVIRVTNGVDIYMYPQKSLRSFGNKLQKKFGGELKVSKKLQTRSRLTGRELFRVNVLFRMPKFKKGDIIDYKGEKIKIIAIHKKVFAKDIKSGKKLNLNFKELNK